MSSTEADRYSNSACLSRLHLNTSVTLEHILCLLFVWVKIRSFLWLSKKQYSRNIRKTLMKTTGEFEMTDKITWWTLHCLKRLVSRQGDFGNQLMTMFGKCCKHFTYPQQLCKCSARWNGHVCFVHFISSSDLYCVQWLQLLIKKRANILCACVEENSTLFGLN